MFYPSILAHMLSSLVMAASVLFGLYYFSKLKSLDSYRILVLGLLFTIVLTIHGISHALLEKEYNFIPFNMWKLPVKNVECPCMKRHS
jgi:4-hydroxybenzoate polyprenyltransferase